MGGVMGGDTVIIGGGYFGRLAIERLRSRVKMVVDIRQPEDCDSSSVPWVIADGVRTLDPLLAQNPDLQWIVPAIPIHLLKEWLTHTLANHYSSEPPLPQEALPLVPMIFAGRASQYYLSLAEFQCPDDCPEPANLCTSTGKPRGEDLHKRLAAVKLPGWKTCVLRSRQLAPGVGGLPRQELFTIRERIRREGGRWLLATSCRCHAVVDGVEFNGNAQ